MNVVFNPLTAELEVVGLTQSQVDADFITGPASVVDNAIVRYDGITGRVVQGSRTTIDDDGLLSVIGSGTSNPRVRFEDPGSHSFSIGTNNNDNRFYIEDGDSQKIVTIDGSNNRVGFNKESPQRTLDIVGNFGFQDASSPTMAVKYDFGGAIDCAAGGNDFYISVFDNGDFTGTQAFHIIMQKAANGGNTLFKRSAIFNDDMADLDFRVKGDGDSSMLFGDASTDRVGIGTDSPASKLTITGGDAEITASANGIILKSPDGTRYRVTVANGGTLNVAAV